MTSESYRKTREYIAWVNMRTRCRNVNAPNYKYYGGRGVSICKEWEEYKVFLRDMGRCPENFMIDRIDVNGDYEPSNCRWVDRKTSNRNKRCKEYLYLNEYLTVAQLACKYGCDKNKLAVRLNRGWKIERAINEV